ncbi:MAG: Release factor glutamine methyltransferase [candidate division TM6 bacterium GW2011_GWE2_42_60]|nr:MAG: Release factor glutamine methyltransferase [candidate division TM6 bacterium GW2011_GWE2_42_60]HBY05745.1 peptide chain release factor N(5)-glutamine methyltransferase [Candidatus Dependentiae bacterium]
MQKNLYQISSLIKRIEEQLRPVYPHASIATQDAWIILSFVTKTSKASLVAQKNSALDIIQEAALEKIINAIVVQQMPLSYLIGSMPFLNLSITVRPSTLIPRPETEYWCEQLITSLTNKDFGASKRTLLDLCTGSGCIGLSLAKAFPQCMVTAVDIAPEACALAQENAQNNLINQTNITILESDLFTELTPGTFFDVIVANPPYISQEAYDILDPSVKAWEDKKALYADDNGLTCIKNIITQAPFYFSSSSQFRELWIEISHEQADAVTQLFLKRGFDNVRTLQDLAGKNRLVSGAFTL